MKIKIEEKHDNTLLQRQDITFLVDHKGTATPPRVDVLAKLAAMLNCKEDQLYIIKLAGQYGQSISQGYARLYPSKEVAAAQEQAYVIKRHSIEEAPQPPVIEPAQSAAKEKKEEDKEAPKEKAEKPPKKPPAKEEEVKPKAEKSKVKPKKEPDPSKEKASEKPKAQPKPKKEVTEEKPKAKKKTAEKKGS